MNFAYEQVDRLFLKTFYRSIEQVDGLSYKNKVFYNSAVLPTLNEQSNYKLNYPCSNVYICEPCQTTNPTES